MSSEIGPLSVPPKISVWHIFPAMTQRPRLSSALEVQKVLCCGE